MWTPPERIKHTAPEGGWPTAEEAARSRLFAPVQVGPVRLEQCTWVPAMVPWRATEDGFVTPDVLDWYERFARGCPGAIVVEATGVRDIPSGPLLRIGHDRFVPGLRELVGRVRLASGGRTRLFIQIIDFLSIRRRPEPGKYFARFLEITPAHRAHFPDRSDEEIRAALAALPDLQLDAVLTE
ncbi:MAG: NADH:flavin oxidoreductase, partial [Candidatus Eremiobacterota bacterium]